ncbi:hypothetical protein ACVIM8_006714 [Bradyrhizobium sp. USDA 4529]
MIDEGEKLLQFDDFVGWRWNPSRRISPMDSAAVERMRLSIVLEFVDVVREVVSQEFRLVAFGVIDLASNAGDRYGGIEVRAPRDGLRSPIRAASRMSFLVVPRGTGASLPFASLSPLRAAKRRSRSDLMSTANVSNIHFCARCAVAPGLRLTGSSPAASSAAVQVQPSAP